MMNTIEIYANYGVLAHEKMTMYTYPAPDATATHTEKVTVQLPDGWKVVKSRMDDDIMQFADGSCWGINESLTTLPDGDPAMYGNDANGKMRRYRLEIIRRDV